MSTELEQFLSLARRVRRTMKRDSNRFYSARYFANIDLLVAGLERAVNPMGAVPKPVTALTADEAHAHIEQMLREIACQQEDALQMLAVAKDLAEQHDLVIVNGRVEKRASRTRTAKRRKRLRRSRGILLALGHGRKQPRKRRKRPRATGYDSVVDFP